MVERIGELAGAATRAVADSKASYPGVVRNPDNA